MHPTSEQSLKYMLQCCHQGAANARRWQRLNVLMLIYWTGVGLAGLVNLFAQPWLGWFQFPLSVIMFYVEQRGYRRHRRRRGLYVEMAMDCKRLELCATQTELMALADQMDDRFEALKNS